MEEKIYNLLVNCEPVQNFPRHCNIVAKADLEFIPAEVSRQDAAKNVAKAVEKDYHLYPGIEKCSITYISEMIGKKIRWSILFYVT